MPKPTNTQFAVAVNVLTYLAGVDDGRPVSSDELSGTINTSPVYVRRVMTPLRESGVVTSYSGAHGGWVLSRAPESITLAEVWRYVQGDDPLLGLHAPNPTCPIGVGLRGVLIGIDRDLARAVEAQLATTTLAEVVLSATAAAPREAAAAPSLADANVVMR